MKNLPRTAIDNAVSAAAIVPGPILCDGKLKRCATAAASLFGAEKQVPGLPIGNR